MVNVGQQLPADLAVMKRFSGEVVFDATLTGLKTASANLMEGQPFKVDVKMVEQPWQALRGFSQEPDHVYPAKGAIEKWRSIAPGSTIRFKAQVCGIAALGINGKYLYFVLLMDAEPIEVKP